MVVKRLVGGAAALARIVGRDRTSVSRWTGDLPSTEIMRRVLAHARAWNLPLDERHLIWGASVEELDALAPPPRRRRLQPVPGAGAEP